MSNGTIGKNGKRCYKLMIVDDSNLMRRRIERSQQFEELQLVGTAADGVEALDLFRRTSPCRTWMASSASPGWSR